VGASPWVPITIKDNIATLGLKTTNSYPLTANYVPGFDATVVARLRKAGAIILGKTNLPLLAMDTQTNSPIFGLRIILGIYPKLREGAPEAGLPQWPQG